MLRQSDYRPPDSSFSQFLQKEGQEGDKKYYKHGNDAPLYPIIDRDKIVAARWNAEVVSGRIVLTDIDLAVERAEEDKDKDKQSDREDDQDVVDVKARMSIIESLSSNQTRSSQSFDTHQEAIHRQLSSEVVVFTRQHLFAHAGTNFRLEIENGAKTKISTFAALIVLCVLDASTSTECVHTSVDILVQMQTLLSF